MLSEKTETLLNSGKRPLSGAEPPQAIIKTPVSLGFYQAGRLEEAEALATSLTQQFPDAPIWMEGWARFLKATGE